MNTKQEARAIEILRNFNNPDEPYYGCYSGGKDSDAVRILFDLAGVNYELHNNHTTVDTPNTVKYIKETLSQYGDKAFIHMPEKSMWKLIVEKGMPPTRLARYCCAALKEKGGKGRRKVTGVRWAESNNRKNNQGLVTIIGKPNTVMKKCEEIGANFTKTDKGGVVLNTDNSESRRAVESCYRTTSTLINPIIDWSDDDVWEFLHHYGCKSNPEYECGFKRIGCIGCPMAGGKQMKREFAMFPKYRNLYVMAFERMLEKGEHEFDIAKGRLWVDGESVMRWWVGDDPLQITIDDYLKFQEMQQETMEEFM